MKKGGNAPDDGIDQLNMNHFPNKEQNPYDDGLHTFYQDQSKLPQIKTAMAILQRQEEMYRTMNKSIIF